MDKFFLKIAKNMSTYIHNATSKHTATVLFLHGLGDTGNGWLSALKSISSPHIKYICPSAATIPVSLNCGMPMPAWFDIYSLSPGAQEDEAGINASADFIQKHIAEEEKAGIPRNRIIIGGFSQGGAVALYSALSRQQAPLGGVIILSSWLPLHKSFPAALKGNQTTPMLQCHGTADQMVPMMLGEMTSQVLSQLNSKCSFKPYSGLGHSSCEEEMQDVKKFIDKILPPV